MVQGGVARVWAKVDTEGRSTDRSIVPPSRLDQHRHWCGGGRHAAPLFPLLSTGAGRHLVVVSRARATQPEPLETTPANACGARARHSQHIHSLCNDAASERRYRDRVVGAADAPARGDADATCLRRGSFEKQRCARGRGRHVPLIGCPSVARRLPVVLPSISSCCPVRLPLVSRHFPVIFPLISR